MFNDRCGRPWNFAIVALFLLSTAMSGRAQQEPSTPSIDATVSYINSTLAANPSPDWKTCKTDDHEYSIWVDDAHRTIYMQRYYPAVSCRKKDPRPSTFIAANLETGVPVDGERNCDYTVNPPNCKSPVVFHSGRDSYLQINCKYAKTCGHHWDPDEDFDISYRDGIGDALLVNVPTDNEILQQLGRSVLHLVRLMQQERALARTQ